MSERQEFYETEAFYGRTQLERLVAGRRRILRQPDSLRSESRREGSPDCGSCRASPGRDR